MTCVYFVLVYLFVGTVLGMNPVHHNRLFSEDQPSSQLFNTKKFGPPNEKRLVSHRVFKPEDFETWLKEEGQKRSPVHHASTMARFGPWMYKEEKRSPVHHSKNLAKFNEWMGGEQKRNPVHHSFSPEQFSEWVNGAEKRNPVHYGFSPEKFQAWEEKQAEKRSPVHHSFDKLFNIDDLKKFVMDTQNNVIN